MSSEYGPKLKKPFTRGRLAVLSGLLLITFLIWPISNERLTLLYPLRLYSEEKILLREFRNTAGAFGSTEKLSNYPGELVRAIITAEDVRFHYHLGIDPIAIFRAFWQNAVRGKIHSGASTITQQLVRTIYPEYMPENRYARKILESILAFKVSCSTGKSRILEAYLNQVPLPENTSGIAAASVRIFGKHTQLLSREEMVALAVMISRRQFVNENFYAAFRGLWHKLYPKIIPDENYLKVNLANRIKPAGINQQMTEHFVTWLKENNLKYQGDFHTTISANLNQTLTQIISKEMPLIRAAGARHAAVVVLERRGDRNILRAMVGSADFSNPVGGEINHAVRVRSAGSSLKPFVYGLGFDSHIFNAYTMFSDRELILKTGEANETYRPHNNDMQYWGDLTLRESLAASRNIPALSAVTQVGVQNFLDFLYSAGFSHLTQKADYYGPGLALGSGGTTLLDLARLYSALQTHGEMLPLSLGNDTWENEIKIGRRKRMLSPETADRLTSILSDREIRRRAFGQRNFLDFPFLVAAKTGTSKDYRDGWVAGYTPRFVVAVWVGNSEGQPMRSVSGAWGAGRIFHLAMRLVAHRPHENFVHSANLEAIRVCRLTGKSAGPDCPSHLELRNLDERTGTPCTARNHHPTSDPLIASDDTQKPQIRSPIQGERYILNPNESPRRQEIPILIQAPPNSHYSYAIGNETPQPIFMRVREFRALKPGDYTLRIFSTHGLVEEVNFSVR